MPNEEDSIRQRLILATIERIEKDGLAGLTTRGIAAEAGVNSAAINYYFGTKENLVELTLQNTLRHGLVENVDEFFGGKEPTKEILASFLQHMLGGGINYPELVKAQLFSENRARVQELMVSFMKDLYGRLRPILKDDTEEKRLITLIHLMSSIIMVVILPDVFGAIIGLDMKSADTQKMYAGQLVDKLLG